MQKVKIIDSMPGAGKTQYMIGFIKQSPDDQKFIYITPFLDETERIKKSCKGKRFCLPSEIAGKGSKQVHLKELISKNKNISTTHSLFSGIDDETLQLIKERSTLS